MYRLLVMLREFKRTGGTQLVPPETEKSMLLALKRGAYRLDEILSMTEVWRGEILAIEAESAAKYGKGKYTAAKQLEKLRKTAVYEHCRKEVLKDGGIPV